MKEKGLVTEYLYSWNYENEIIEKFNNNGYTYNTSFEDNGVYPGFRYLSEEKISFDEINFGNTDIAKAGKRNPFSLYNPYDSQENTFRELFILDAYQTRDMNPKSFLAFIQDRFTKNKVILDMAELDSMRTNWRGHIKSGRLYQTK